MANKIDLIKKWNHATGISMPKLKVIFDILVEKLIETVIEDGELHISSLGKFYIHTYAPRKVNMPGSTETVQIGERRVLKFKSMPKIKKMLNK